MNRAALHQISYGLYIVTSGQDGKFNGQIANSIVQATSKPATLAICINKENYTHELIQEQPEIRRFDRNRSRADDLHRPVRL